MTALLIHIASEINAKNKLSTCPFVVCAATEKKRLTHHNQREQHLHTKRIEACAWEMIKMLASALCDFLESFGESGENPVSHNAGPGLVTNHTSHYCIFSQK